MLLFFLKKNNKKPEHYLPVNGTYWHGCAAALYTLCIRHSGKFWAEEETEERRGRRLFYVLLSSVLILFGGC